FAVVEGKIRFGLNAVKNVGEATCRAIVAAREEDGPFASIWDFTERVDPSVANKRSLESLVSCGALDSSGASRKGMLHVLEDPLGAIRDQLRKRTDCTLVELERRREGETVLAGGMVASQRSTVTKKGEPMAFVQLEDLTGSIEVVVFNSTYAAARELLVEDAVLVVKGRV